MKNKEVADTKNIRYSYGLIILSMISMVMCVTANIISSDLVSLPLIRDIPGIGQYIGMSPCGVFLFPFVYVISDVISEVYGYRISRWNAWLTLLASLFVTYFTLFVAKVIPHPVFVGDLNNSLSTIFGASAWVIIGSIASTVFGGWTNDIIFQKHKHIDGKAKFAKRKLLSSAAGEMVDTVSFICIAFGLPALLGIEGYPYTWKNVVGMICIQFVIKYALEAITEPLAYKAACKVRSIEGDDVFEDRNNFNLFGFYKK